MVCFLVDAIVFFFLAKTLPSLLQWQRSVDNSIDDRQTIIDDRRGLIAALTIDKLSISTALSIMHVW